MNDNQARDTYRQRQTQVVDRVVPSALPQSRPHVSLWNRVSAYCCIGICTAVLWFIAGIGAKIEIANQSIYKLQVQMQTMTANNASLTAEVDNLTKPTRVLNLAMNRFHMHYANPIVISKGNP